MSVPFYRYVMILIPAGKKKNNYLDELFLRIASILS